MPGGVKTFDERMDILCACLCQHPAVILCWNWISFNKLGGTTRGVSIPDRGRDARTDSRHGRRTGDAFSVFLAVWHYELRRCVF